MKIILTPRELETIGLLARTLPKRVRTTPVEWFLNIEDRKDGCLSIEIQEGLVLTLLDFIRDAMPGYIRWLKFVEELLLPEYTEKFKKLKDAAKERI